MPLRDNPYKNFNVYGIAPALKTFFDCEDGTPIDCKYYARFSRDTGQNKLMTMADHVKAIQSEERFRKSVLKCDHKPKLPSGAVKEDLLETAFQYTRRMFSFMYGVKPTTVIDFNRATSPGMPYNKEFKTKGDFLQSGRLLEEMNKREWSLFKINSKDEFLPRESVENDEKVRTFFSPNIAALARQKIFTTEANKRLKEHSANPKNWQTCWSRYGFTKQFGGFDDLMKFHAFMERHSTGDASGYDRVLAVMYYVWRLREEWLRYKCMDGPEIFYPDAFWEDFYQVRDEVCAPYCVMPDGTILQRLCGNPSGSDTTTTDNTIGHALIKFYQFLLAGWYLLGRKLEYEEIIEHILASLYGDDDFTSHDGPDFFGPDYTDERWKEIAKEAYEDFGMTIKSSAWAQVVGDPIGMEFLGSECLKKGAFFYPKPRLSKLCASAVMCVKGKQKTPIQLFSTVRALWELTKGVPDPDCEAAATELESFADWLLREPEIVESLPIQCIQQLQEVAGGHLDKVNSLRFGWEARQPSRAGW